jgi:hypothetical protein
VLKSDSDVTEDAVEPASTGLAKIFRDLLARYPADERPVIAWPAICGSAVARRTRPLDFVDGVLRVEVPDKNWKLQLTDLAPRYVADFSQFVGPKVRFIQFVLPDDPGPADFR